MTTKTSKLIGLRLPIELYNLISKKAEQEHRPISNYIKKALIDQLETTDYLLSTQANHDSMYKILKSNPEKNSLVFNSIEDVKKYVQDLAN